MNSPMNQPSKDFYSVKDDARPMADPAGTGLIGREVGKQDFTKSALGHPVILYRSKDGSKEFFLTADVYAMPGEPMAVHIYCPLCANHLTIKQNNKAIDYDRDAPVKIPGYNAAEIAVGLNVADLGGRLSIEQFRCTWEEKPELRRSFGFGVCEWSVVIDNNVARNV